MNYYTHSGNLPPGAACYVARAADEEVFEALTRGEFCYVLTSSQMGKSSLLVRTKDRLERQGILIAAFSLEAVGSTSIQAPEQFYFGILDKIGAKLGLEDELTDFWDANNQLSPVQRLLKTLGFAASRSPTTQPPSQPRHLVVMIDEIGLVRQLGFPTGELFGAIRENHSLPLNDPARPPLTFCLFGTATPSELVDDPAITPFHIGRRIELNDFTLSEAAHFARGFAEAGVDPASAAALVRRVHYWTNGHPALTQKLCGAALETLARPGSAKASPPIRISRPHAAVDRLCEEMFFTGDPLQKSEMLACVQDRLLRAGPQLADVLDLYHKIRDGRRVADDQHDQIISQLLLSGIIRSEHGRLAPRNRIYKRAFGNEWIRSNMPQAELRRQRDAWRRGVTITAAAACVVVSIIAILVSMLIVRIRGEQNTWARSQVDQARLERLVVQTGFLARERSLDGTPATPANPRLQSLTRLSNAVPVLRNDSKLLIEAAAWLHLPDLLPYHPSPKPTPAAPWASTDGTYLGIRITNQAGVRFALIHRPSNSTLLEIAGSVPDRAISFGTEPHGQTRLALALPTGGIQTYNLQHTNLTTGPLLKSSGLLRFPTRVSCQPDGPWIAEATSNSSRIHLHNPATSKVLALRYPAEVVDLDWHPSGRALAVATALPALYIELLPDLDPAPANLPQRRLTLDARLEAPSALTFNHRGDCLAYLDGSQGICLWQPWAGIQLSFPLRHGPVHQLRFSRDDLRLDAWCDRTGTCQSWEISGGEYTVLPVFPKATDERLDHFDLHPDGNALIVGSSSSLTLFDLVRTRWTADFPLTKAASAHWLPGSDGILVGSRETGLERITLGPASPQDLPPTPWLRLLPISHPAINTGVSAAAPLSHHQTVVALPMELRILSLGSDHPISNLPSDHSYDELTPSTDAQWLAARRATDPTLDLWHLPSKRIALEGLPAGHAAFDAGSTALFLVQNHHLAKVDLLPSGPLRRPQALADVKNISGPFALHPAGRLIATCEPGSIISLYARSPKPPHEYEKVLTLDPPASSPWTHLLFNPNRQQLLALDQNNRLHCWDLGRFQEQLHLLHLKVALIPARPSPAPTP